MLLADRLDRSPIQVMAHRILPGTGHEVARTARVGSKRSRQRLWLSPRLQRDNQDDGACCSRNAPELIVRCLTPMFPTLTLAQRRVPAPDERSDPAMPNTSARAISPRQTFRRRWSVRSRWSDNSQDADPVAAPAVRAPFATGQHEQARSCSVTSTNGSGRRRPRFCFGLGCAAARQ